MKPYLRFILVWLVNYIVLYLANSYYPVFYELGNANLTQGMATVVASLLLTLAGRLGKELLMKWKIKADGRIKKFAIYWLLNSGAIWLIARFASLTGFGIVAYYHALTLGFVAALTQWLARQVFKKAKLV